MKKKKDCREKIILQQQQTMDVCLILIYIYIFFRLILFKILAQFVILGCTWVLGLYQSNLFFQVMFILLNSQQGTFLFIVHCVLNKEVNSLLHML